MAILRPNQLPAATTPLGSTDLVVVDQGAGGVNATEPVNVVDAVAPVVSQADAEAGIDNEDRMTALRTKQSIASEVGVSLASAAQGALADTSVQPTRQVIAGSGLTGGGSLSADVTLNVGAGTGISVSADTVGLDATTQSRLLSGGGTVGQVLQKNSSTDYDVSWATVAAATAVSYAVQSLSDAEKEQARQNISVDKEVVQSSKSGNYTAVASDNNAIIRFSATATLTLTAAATLGDGWHALIVADGGTVTIDPNASETINGATTLSVSSGTSVVVWCTGTAFFAQKDAETFVKKSGGAMTGSLEIDTTNAYLRLNGDSNEWYIQAEETGTRFRLVDATASVEVFSVSTAGAVTTSQLGDLATRIDTRAGTWSVVRPAIAGMTVGDIGSLIFATKSTAGAVAYGATTPGSGLNPASATGPNGAAMSGTYRCLGYSAGGGGAASATLWVKTAL